MADCGALVVLGGIVEVLVHDGGIGPDEVVLEVLDMEVVVGLDEVVLEVLDMEVVVRLEVLVVLMLLGVSL